MDDHVRKALEQGHVIDITTIGRKSGLPRRIEIAFYNLDGRLYLWAEHQVIATALRICRSILNSYSILKEVCMLTSGPGRGLS
jgi:hypothetical protein